MAATPRASGFWETDPRMSRSDSAGDYFTEEGLDYDEEQQERLLDGDEAFDGRTPLDRTIDRIGMGSYQWTLLSLCGLGWMADNMWIQAIAIVLPRVQRHYDVSDAYIGALSSSMFAGMMLGAIGWGTCSDLMGRITAFNATLFFTAVFGILASLSNSFFTLCLALFFLGSSVGGSMPTDGTLLLEHMPKSKQYLVTALSVFFSVGAVLSAVIGLLVIPQHSCLAGAETPCDPSKDNLGWKYLLITLALLTLFMFLARMVFFRLHESPRYLVSAGRPQDAIKSLQLISRFNGSEMEVELDDVRDHHHPEEQAALQASLSGSPAPKLVTPPTPQRATSRTVLFDAAVDLEGGGAGGSRGSNEPVYASIGETPALGSRAASVDGTRPLQASPVEEEGPGQYPQYTTTSAVDPSHPDYQPPVIPRRPRPSHMRRQSSAASRRSRASVYEQKFFWALPHAVRKPLWAWWDRVMSVLSPEWLRTTLLVWGAWWSMSLAYTMFNVFLPKLLETGTTLEPELSSASPKALEASLWDVVIFTIGGCPGAILGAYLIESRLGRRWSLAGSTLITAFFCMVFAMVTSPWAIRASTVGISLSATAMWAVLYGWTPEIFATSVRGSACGIASALSRIGGMIAPILGGILLTMSRTLPVYTSVVVFLFAAVCVVMLKEEPRGTSGPGGVDKEGSRPLAVH